MSPTLPAAHGETPAPFQEDLLAWLRERLAASRLGYRAPPVILPGGTDPAVRNWRVGLRGAPPGCPETVVLRLFASAAGTRRVALESRVQAALARAGYPAPKVLGACHDRSVLGGAFFVMEFVEGGSLVEAPPQTIPAVLCRAHAALHAIPPAPLREALRDDGGPSQPGSPADDLERLSQRARRHPGLVRIVAWMADNLPPASPRPAVCHGDLHPGNVIVREGRLAGVLDWPNATLAGRELDVGSVLTLGIVARHLVSPAPPPGLWESFFERYRREAPLDPRTLDYYRTRRGLKALLSAAGGRRMWRHPAVVADLVRDLRDRTGVALPDPPWNA